MKSEIETTAPALGASTQQTCGLPPVSNFCPEAPPPGSFDGDIDRGNNPAVGSPSSAGLPLALPPGDPAPLLNNPAVGSFAFHVADEPHIEPDGLPHGCFQALDAEGFALATVELHGRRIVRLFADRKSTRLNSSH